MDSEKGKRYPEDNDSTEALLSCERLPRPTRSFINLWTVSITANIVLFLSSLSILLISYHHEPSIQQAIKRTSIYSPVLDDITLRLQTTQFNGTLLPGPDPSPWRGLPSDPEAEAAWDAFEHIRTMPLTASQIRRMGKDPGKVAQFSDSVFHLGPDAYVGALDFFHQIHCLNTLRKAAFLGNSGLAGRPALETIHLQHCTDMLMQHLLCTADTGMITYEWVEDNEHPFPDFGVMRECRGWRQLVEWRDEKAVDLETYRAWRKPEGVKGRGWPPEYWEVMRKVEEQGGKNGGSDER